MYRVDKILRDSWYQQCLANNAALEKERRFCKHDLQHMLDVARIAYMLVLENSNGSEAAAAREGMEKTVAGKELVYAAGLLHDMARWKEYQTGEDHALAGSLLAGPVLDRTGYDAAEREIIVRAIREHRSGGPEASLLGQFLCTADDLSRPCSRCDARAECHKIHRMAVARHLLY